MAAAMTTSTAAVALVTPSLTTTFTPTATTCTQHLLTMLANREYEIWVNMPVPVPGTTLTDCYPSQYMTSYLQSAGGVTQAAFDPLICPRDYSAVGPYTSNYIACCPSGYSFAEPTVIALALRPAFGGTCYSPIYEATPVIVTQYGNASVTATTTYSASVTNAQAYALPYDGYAYGVAEVPSITSATTTTTSPMGNTETLVLLPGTSPASSSNTASNTTSTNDISIGVKAGLSAGVAAGVLALLTLSIWCFRRNRGKNPSAGGEEDAEKRSQWSESFADPSVKNDESVNGGKPVVPPKVQEMPAVSEPKEIDGVRKEDHEVSELSG